MYEHNHLRSPFIIHDRKVFQEESKTTSHWTNYRAMGPTNCYATPCWSRWPATSQVNLSKSTPIARRLLETPCLSPLTASLSISTELCPPLNSTTCAFYFLVNQDVFRLYIGLDDSLAVQLIHNVFNLMNPFFPEWVLCFVLYDLSQGSDVLDIFR